MKVIQYCILLTCIGILIILCSIRIKLQDRSTHKQVTEVHYYYRYNVESYGTISLNDKLVDFVAKEE